MNLEQKTVLITGAAKRLGAAIARHLALKGCRLFLHFFKSEKEAKMLAAELSKQTEVQLFCADLEDTTATLHLADQALSAGPIDVLVNNASIFYPVPFESLSALEFDCFLNTNAKAPFLLSQKIGLAMKHRAKNQEPKDKASPACIINLADLAGFYPRKNFLAYGLSKAVLLSLTRGLALELAPEVRVNSICPGPMLPPEHGTVKTIEQIQKSVPLKRWGGADPIAEAVAFLCESDYINGIELVIDGGENLV